MKHSKLALLISAAIFTSAGAYASDNNVVDVVQNGTSNTANVTQQVGSDNNDATIDQDGTSNVASVTKR